MVSFNFAKDLNQNTGYTPPTARTGGGTVQTGPSQEYLNNMKEGLNYLSDKLTGKDQVPFRGGAADAAMVHDYTNAGRPIPRTLPLGGREQGEAGAKGAAGLLGGDNAGGQW